MILVFSWSLSKSFEKLIIWNSKNFKLLKNNETEFYFDSWNHLKFFSFDAPGPVISKNWVITWATHTGNAAMEYDPNKPDTLNKTRVNQRCSSMVTKFFPFYKWELQWNLDLVTDFVTQKSVTKSWVVTKSMSFMY